ncbi:uncharacterized protein LOC112569184 [Pomacea canaliculata]|uniref:uncharacterized protein LOC112569184 n=1 Tax=Pomacea canaliculata TaxID=400727 RepID=UPI000D726326|nr:uncharacterized protein LOC112569184 [Pomacea canaliculata]
MMNRFHLMLLLCILPSVSLFGVEYICPTFREGVNIVVCKINKTAASDSSKCTTQQNVTFDWTSKHTVTLCTAPAPSSSACKIQNSPLPKTCWCDKSDQDIFTYKFAFVANKSIDTGALLECTYCVPHMENVNIDGCNISNIELSRAHLVNKTPAWIVTLFLSGIAFSLWWL